MSALLIRDVDAGPRLHHELAVFVVGYRAAFARPIDRAFVVEDRTPAVKAAVVLPMGFQAAIGLG